MNKIERYRKIKEDANSLKTREEIHNFVEKYKLLPMGIINELQDKLNIINKDNKGKGINAVHTIYTK